VSILNQHATVGHGADSCARFSFSRIAAWAPGVETAEEWGAWARGDRSIGEGPVPALPQMPGMLRRHAARLGRMVCDVAYRALDGATGVPIVYSSRYGEVARSVELLSALARRDDLSPTSFSLSVHNAMVGLLAIARHDTANIIAIAGGDDGAACGVVEAAGLLADGAPRVLLVVADCVLPAPHDVYADVRQIDYAWAALLEPAGDDPIELFLESAPSQAQIPHTDAQRGRPTDNPAAMELLRFLYLHEAEFVHQTGSGVWRWLRGA
jgi:hypothetical protein